MQIDIFHSPQAKSEHHHERFYTTSEALWYDAGQRVLSIDRPLEEGGPVEFGAVEIEKILDRQLFLKGLERTASGIGFAPPLRAIVITFL